MCTSCNEIQLNKCLYLWVRKKEGGRPGGVKLSVLIVSSEAVCGQWDAAKADVKADFFFIELIICNLYKCALLEYILYNA